MQQVLTDHMHADEEQAQTQHHLADDVHHAKCFSQLIWEIKMDSHRVPREQWAANAAAISILRDRRVLLFNVVLTLCLLVFVVSSSALTNGGRGRETGPNGAQLLAVLRGRRIAAERGA